MTRIDLPSPVALCAALCAAPCATLYALALAASAPAQAAEPTPPTAADFERASRLLPSTTNDLVLHTVESPAWLPGDRLTYWTRTSEGRSLVLADPARHARTDAPDQRSMAPDFTRDTGESTDASVSPDGTRAVFLRDGNLWERELASGTEAPLTTDGATDFGYATDNEGWRHSNHPIVLWSQDSKRIATFQQDQRGVKDAYLVATAPGHPHVESWKYPLAGDPIIPKLYRVIIDVASSTDVSSRVLRLSMPPDVRRSSTGYGVDGPNLTLADTQWSTDGAELAFISMSRDNKHATFRLANAATGTVRDVLQESAPTYYESNVVERDVTGKTQARSNWRYFSDTHELIWYSERDNWGHLYLYDTNTGHLKNRITTGQWNVSQVVRVDPRARAIYFLGVGREPGRDPYFEHLYRVRLDGSGLKLLTPENATHDILFEPSGKYFLDRYSAPDAPPTAIVRDRDGRLVSQLERADISKLRTLGWQPPQPISVKARDGATDLYGLLYVPRDLDPTRHYPLVDFIYPGPQIGSIFTRAFTPSGGAEGDAQSLAELGFVVLQVDGMGTPLRSKAFHDHNYGNIGDNTLPDQVAAIRQLAARHPWIDLSRVGIYGISGGGNAAARAMLQYPDFFKVGVAESGDHDPRSYTDSWAEKWLGLLTRGADGRTNYDGQDNASLAANLRGHLLIVYGTLDDNVPPHSSLGLVDALIKQNRDFDLLALPNQGHMAEGESARYLARRRWNYFLRYLADADRP